MAVFPIVALSPKRHNSDRHQLINGTQRFALLVTSGHLVLPVGLLVVKAAGITAEGYAENRSFSELS